MRTINQAGIDLIKRFEGFSSTPYLCPANVPTIGYGATWDANGDKMTMDHKDITEAEGEWLMTEELAIVANAVTRLIQGDLTDNEFAAVCSLTYNIGSGNLQSSTLRQKLNRNEKEQAVLEFPKWRRGGGQILPGLVRRRAEEVELFLTED